MLGPMMRTRIAAVVVASTLAGAGIGFALSVPTTATAQNDSGGSGSTSTTAPPRSTPPWVADALKKLVDAGTITQAQADAVAKSLAEATPPPHHRGPGDGPHELAAAAKAIGISEEQLRTELRAGASLADVAKAHNVDVQKVIDALVAEKEAKLAEAVKNGRITQAEADRIKADLTQRITDRVNGTFAPHKHGLGHGHGPGFGPPRPQATPQSTTDS